MASSWMKQLFYSRLKAKCGSDFTLSNHDFGRFVLAMGPVPEDMVKPTVGRIDHTKGYVWDKENNRWNFRWQEASENQAGATIIQLANGTHSSIRNKREKVERVIAVCPCCGHKVRRKDAIGVGTIV